MIHRFLTALLLLLSASLTGCTPPPVLAPDPRVHMAAAVAFLRAEPVVFTKDFDGTLRVTLVLHNPTASDVDLLTHIDWYDESGRPLPTSLRGNRSRAVPRESDAIINESLVGIDHHHVVDTRAIVTIELYCRGISLCDGCFSEVEIAHCFRRVAGIKIGRASVEFPQ